MSVQLWTYILVGITFAFYIGIAIWSRAGSTKEFYVAGEEFLHWRMEWRQLQIGCQRLLLFLWQA